VFDGDGDSDGDGVLLEDLLEDCLVNLEDLLDGEDFLDGDGGELLAGAAAPPCFLVYFLFL
jgi:hypothetical protein